MGSKMRHRLFKPIALFTLISLLILLLVILVNIDIDGMLRFSDRLKAFPTIEAHYGSIANKISAATAGDTVLDSSERKLNLVHSDLYRGCIIGGLNRIYATNRAYSEVLASFAKAFSESNWTRNDAEDFFTIETALVSVSVIEPSQLVDPTNKDNFKVLYTLDFIYGDPAVRDCSG